jgi:MerR family transcriptional regulator, redox-sensitive transcriptional activator SoxR
VNVELLPIGVVAARSGMAPSALRYYEEQGLISATRTAGGARRYPRSVLRRLAVIRAARNIGLSLPEIRTALATLPDGLSSCIGCGCLSLTKCALSNPGDVAAGEGAGARWLPPALRRVPPAG